jgi:exosortase D (VPLPA-CTERM-specific)
MSVQTLPPPRQGTTLWKLSPTAISITLVAFALSLWPFWDGLARMWGWWVEEPEYSHALLIPPIAAFLVWQQKDRLARITFTGSFVGVLLVLIGGALLLLGQLGTIYTLVEYAYLVTLLGLVLSFTGPEAFRTLRVPLFILFLMVPLPQFVLANLSTKLQLLSSQLGVWFIRLFDISVLVEGNVIDLGGYKLQVAEACDGLRYLFPLMTLGFLMAYFYKGATWKRLFIFLSSVPITLLMNSFRVGTIGVMVEHWGIGMAEGFLHEFQGWAVFMASAAFMFAEMVVLNRVTRENGTWRQLFGIELPAPSRPGVAAMPRAIPRSFLVACALLALFAAVVELMPRTAEVMPARTRFSSFPLELGGWHGQRATLEGLYLDALKLDDYFLADYSTGSDSVNVYMAYYDSQRKGEAVHSPRSCLPGGGWQLREFGQRRIAQIRIDGEPLTVNRTVIELGEQRELVYYWFQQRGRVITNEFAVKWYLFYDALTRHRTDGALVRVIASIPRGSDEAHADAQLQDLAAQLATRLPAFVPR